MSNLYESIPPNRRQDFLHNAENAFNQATGPSVDKVVRHMGGLVVEGAEIALKAHEADREDVVKEAERHALDAQKNTATVGDDAEAYLRAVDEHGVALVEADYIVNRSAEVPNLTHEQQVFIALAATGTPYDPDNKPRTLQQEFTDHYIETTKDL